MRLILVLGCLMAAATTLLAQWRVGVGGQMNSTGIDDKGLQSVPGCVYTPDYTLARSVGFSPHLHLETKILSWLSIGVVGSFFTTQQDFIEAGYAMYDSLAPKREEVNEQFFAGHFGWNRVHVNIEIPIRVAWELRVIPLVGMAVTTSTTSSSSVNYVKEVGPSGLDHPCDDLLRTTPGETGHSIYQNMEVDDVQAIYFHVGLGLRYDINLGDKIVVSPTAEILLVPNHTLPYRYGMSSLGIIVWYRL